MSFVSSQSESNITALPPIASVSEDRNHRWWTEKQIVHHDSNLSLTTSDTSTTKFGPSRPKTSTLRQHLLGCIRVDALAEIELLLLTFCIGMQDAVSFPDYHCFASNQTGNTIFLALAAVDPAVATQLFAIPNVAISLALFLLGVCLTGQLGHRLSPPPTGVDDRSSSSGRARPWLVATNFLQTVLVLGAAGLQFRFGTGSSSTNSTVTQHPSHNDPTARAVLALLAFAAGSQVTLARSLRRPEISTAMATAAWVDLLMDPRVLASGSGGGGRNRARDRRAMFLVALVVGGLAGAGVYRWHGSRWSILISGLGKLVVTVMFLFNGTEQERAEEERV
ncbi:MAG: hypothetical protein M1821_004582 [Bathelium mastoideum]|nr:MAG: hypothetical protein M1821_004582 [Bathelium mastoideum]